MKKIMILIDQLHTHGGIEKLTALKANYWTEKLGYEVIIVSTGQEDRVPVYKLSPKVRFLDLNISYHPGMSFFHPRNILKLIKNYKSVQHLIGQESPDFIVVASHIPMTYLVPFLKSKAKTIKEFHFSKYDLIKDWKQNVFDFVEGRYDRLVVLSEEEKKFYPTKNVVVIPNPVDVPEVKLMPYGERENIAAAVLRFAPVKQLEKMVSVWEKFHGNNPEWQFHIFGSTGNAYFDEIEQLVKQKNLEKTIVFRGNTGDVFSELNRVKLLLMTSKHECFPMVILEAHACGVPVFSFDSPTGPRNIIHQGVDGELVPCGDVDEFAARLDQAVKRPELLLGMSAFAIKNSEKYHTDKIMDLWKNAIFDPE